MEILFQAVEALSLLIAGLLTVPVLDVLKRASSLVDRAPDVVKQGLAVTIAGALTKLGALLSVTLPTDLTLFTGSTVEALVAAAIAFGVHAGRKAREASE